MGLGIVREGTHTSTDTERVSRDSRQDRRFRPAFLSAPQSPYSERERLSIVA